MLIPSTVIDRIRGRLPTFPSTRLEVIAVEAEGDPLDFVRAGCASVGWAGFFGLPEGREIGGLGVAWRFDAPPGSDRLARLTAAIADAELPPSAQLLTGFSYSPDGPHAEEWDGFAPASVVLPMVALIREGGSTSLQVAIPAGRSRSDVVDLLESLAVPGPPARAEAAEHRLESHPVPARWREAVAEVVGAIGAGALEKVVLARSVLVESTAPPEPFAVVELLRSGYPRCYAFGWQEGEAAFVGASPELLASRRGREVVSCPLAGSAPRGEGEEEDALLGELLITSHKDREEHALVVADIAARLRPLSAALEIPEGPTVRKMATVQHLATVVRATLDDGQKLLDIAAELHPTPAVGGTPRGDALRYIDKLEVIDRGWYAGGIGWADSGGDGEVAIGLRSGLLRGTTAHLYAGAGIVAESDPAAELAETRWKLRPLVDLLTAS